MSNTTPKPLPSMLPSTFPQAVDWQWLPGMLVRMLFKKDGQIEEYRQRIGEDGALPPIDDLLSAEPVLDDPATEGCIHWLAERAYGSPIPMRYENRWLLPNEYNHPSWYGELRAVGYVFLGRSYPTRLDVYLLILQGGHKAVDRTPFRRFLAPS